MNEILLTVDSVVIINNEKILLIKRAKEPFMEKYAFPGGHVDLDDIDTKSACARELQEETGLKVNPEDLEFLIILDELNRDPRPGRRISIVYKINLPSEDLLKDCKADSDAKELIIKNIDELKPDDMAFDHWKVIEILKNR
ncbi:MAG: NUDIX hydrolase [Candidatus Magasanikiibacteriota bacterium]